MNNIFILKMLDITKCTKYCDKDGDGSCKKFLKIGSASIIQDKNMKASGPQHDADSHNHMEAYFLPLHLLLKFSLKNHPKGKVMEESSYPNVNLQ